MNVSRQLSAFSPLYRVAGTEHDGLLAVRNTVMDASLSLVWPFDDAAPDGVLIPRALGTNNADVAALRCSSVRSLRDSTFRVSVTLESANGQAWRAAHIANASDRPRAAISATAFAWRALPGVGTMPWRPVLSNWSAETRVDPALYAAATIVQRGALFDFTAASPNTLAPALTFTSSMNASCLSARPPSPDGASDLFRITHALIDASSDEESSTAKHFLDHRVTALIIRALPTTVSAVGGPNPALEGTITATVDFGNLDFARGTPVAFSHANAMHVITVPLVQGYVVCSGPRVLLLTRITAEVIAPTAVARVRGLWIHDPLCAQAIDVRNCSLAVHG
jgi:hypothetical protein